MAMSRLYNNYGRSLDRERVREEFTSTLRWLRLTLPETAAWERSADAVSQLFGLNMEDVLDIVVEEV